MLCYRHDGLFHINSMAGAKIITLTGSIPGVGANPKLIENMYTPTFFTAEAFPNSHIEFDSEGIKLRVSLNITRAMKPFLSPNNIFVGKTYRVYSISKRVDNPNLENLKATYELLMTRAMINCRLAKQEVLKKEINKLVFNFNN